MSAYRFLPLENIDLLRQTQISRNAYAGESCIIIGENSPVRSSLLFQAALSIASEGDQVLFICPESLPKRPYPVSAMTEPTNLVLRCIKMIYISDPPDLLKYLCEFHTTASLPSAILVDGIEYFVSHISQNASKEAAMIKLFAVLEDTVKFVAQKKGEACHRMVSLFRDTYQKEFIKGYFREIWNISGGMKEEEYLLTDNHVPAFQVQIHVSTENKIVVDKVYRLPSEAENEA